MEQILILHGGALGDCALSLHIVMAIRRALPAVCITLAARSPLRRWAKRRGIVDEILSPDAAPLLALYSAGDAATDQAAGFLRAYDQVISFLGGPNEPVSQRLHDVAGERLKAVDPRPTEVTCKTGRHITRQWAEELLSPGQSLIIPDDSGITLDRRWAGEINRRLAAKMDAGEQDTVICHPGSGGRSKCCSVEALEELVRQFRGANWAVGWMIGPDELEQFGDAYATRLARTAPVLYEESVEAAADLVCGAAAFVGNDAGMTHVAALAGCCTVALFGPTDPRVWRPLGADSRVVRFPAAGQRFDEWAEPIVGAASGPI